MENGTHKKNYNVSTFKLNLFLHAFLFSLILTAFYVFIPCSTKFIIVLLLFGLIYAFILLGYSHNYNLLYTKYLKEHADDRNDSTITWGLIKSSYHSFLASSIAIILPLVIAILIIYIFV